MDEQIPGGTPTPETQTETPSVEKVPIHVAKFLGKERPIYEEEKGSLFQKGLNYDHVAEQKEKLAQQLAEYESLLKPIGGKDALSQLAKQRGLESYMAQNNIVDEEAALPGYNSYLEAERLREENERLMAPKRLQERRDEVALGFMEAKDMRWEDIPEKVRDNWLNDSNPDTLESYYKDYLLEQKEASFKDLERRAKELEEAIEAKKTNQENAEAAVGSLSTTDETPIENMNISDFEKLSETAEGRKFIEKHRSEIRKLIGW